MGDTAGVEFAAWYREEHRRLVAAMLLVTGDIHVAEEAADEAFARAYGHWPRVSQMASPRGWTYRVALNVVRRRWRRAELERRLLARQPPPSTVPAPAGEAWEVVRRLPARQRTAVVLRFLADLTEEQVGIAMGVSRSTISSSLADARRALGRMLAEPDELEVRCVV